MKAYGRAAEKNPRSAASRCPKGALRAGGFLRPPALSNQNPEPAPPAASAQGQESFHIRAKRTPARRLPEECRPTRRAPRAENRRHLSEKSEFFTSRSLMAIINKKRRKRHASPFTERTSQLFTRFISFSALDEHHSRQKAEAFSIDLSTTRRSSAEKCPVTQAAIS